LEKHKIKHFSEQQVASPCPLSTFPLDGWMDGCKRIFLICLRESYARGVGGAHLHYSLSYAIIFYDLTYTII
jgi:hypothetical protein